MDVKSTIDPKTIAVNSDAHSKKEVLRQIVNYLFAAGNINNKDQFLKSVYKRESEGITGIGNGVAIPHGQSKSVINPGVAIVTLKKPIPWESLDEQPIKIVVLFAVSNSVGGAKTHLKLLSEFAKKLGNDQVLDSLKGARDVTEIAEAFN